MKRFYYTVACTFASLTLAPPSFGHSGGTDANGCHAGSKPYHCHNGADSAARENHGAGASGDMDCSDFNSWEDAQAFFEESGYGDPHRLDADDDGIACEALK